MRPVIISDRIDERHSPRHQKITRSSMAPVVLLKVDDGAIIPCLLVFLILRLNNGRCLHGALLKELKTLTTLVDISFNLGMYCTK